ncbi:hypothetical protein IFR05_014762 [Cadophora sp. M221]|nr:hypothetical protein IFR05_014762 [Cadophora sp. M221]
MHDFNAFAYPAIPLSRILHPSDAPYPYPEAVLAVRAARNEAVLDKESEFIDPDLESKDKLLFEPIRRKLKQRQSGLQALMSKRPVGPRAVGGILSMLNAFNAAPIEPTTRNTELLYYFLMASAAQSYAGTIAKAETLHIKSQVLSQVNKYIQNDFYQVGNQALRIVIHLVVLELRGGLEAMDDALNYNVLIVTDYELACAFERELDLQSMETAIGAVLTVGEWLPESIRSPLLHYPISFQECKDSLNLSQVAAEILDDVRFLTTSITSCFLSPELETTKTSKIQSTAEWLYKRIETIPELSIVSITPTSEIIIDTIRLCALVYSSSIKTLTPLSQNFPPELQERFYSNISLVGLKNWKDVPGIFLWILLVATPCGKDDHRGRFLRKQMACTGMAIGMDDFHLGTAGLRALWLVQRWIVREGLEARNQASVVIDAGAHADPGLDVGLVS